LVAPGVVTLAAVADATGKPWTSTAPMSTALPEMRTKPRPRWSVERPVGTRALEPAWSSGLLAAGSWVGVGPPLLPRAASVRVGVGGGGERGVLGGGGGGGVGPAVVAQGAEHEVGAEGEVVPAGARGGVAGAVADGAEVDVDRAGAEDVRAVGVGVPRDDGVG